MAQPFTPQQLCEIRERLIDSARRHALTTGAKKTSLDALTADAGISKSSFYRFFESKELLFLEVADRWEEEIIGMALSTLDGDPARSDRQRAADMIMTAFRAVHEMGVAHFLIEDLPQLLDKLPDARSGERYCSSSERIFTILKRAQIRFTVPDETVLAIIRMLYLSVLHIGQIGTDYFPALHALVEGAFIRLVA